MALNFRHKILQLVPPSLRHRLVQLKNLLWGGWRRHYYSHAGEDIYLEMYFHDVKNGFFVDVGAHHPQRYSNTALLYERGWRGINIEPDPYSIELLKKYRKRDINVQAGVAARDGFLEFHRFSDPAVNTFSSANAARLKEKTWLREISVEKIAVKTLHSILNVHLPSGTQINLLNVDVEDLDIDVLRSNDWSRYRPQVVIAEDRLFNILSPERSEIYQYLTKLDYVLDAHLGLSLVFVDRNALLHQTSG